MSGAFVNNPGGFLLSHAVARAVPSAPSYTRERSRREAIGSFVSRNIHSRRAQAVLKIKNDSNQRMDAAFTIFRLDNALRSADCDYRERLRSVFLSQGLFERTFVVQIAIRS